MLLFFPLEADKLTYIIITLYNGCDNILPYKIQNFNILFFSLVFIIPIPVQRKNGVLIVSLLHTCTWNKTSQMTSRVANHHQSHKNNKQIKHKDVLWFWIFRFQPLTTYISQCLDLTLNWLTTRTSSFLNAQLKN